MIRVAIVDDHPVFRQGLRAILSRASGIAIIGEATTGLEGIRLARRAQPDIVLMDIQMPEMDGLMATTIIRQELPQTKVIILSLHHADGDVFESIRSGASGYVLKEDPPDELIKTIQAVSRGHAALSPQVAARVLAEFARLRPDHMTAPVGETGLTPREQEVLALVARGYRNAEVARILSVSLTTVKAHLRNVFRKLQVRSRVQAVLVAGRSGDGAAAPGRQREHTEGP